MSLRPACGRVHHEGFTLLELLAATAVALVTALAVTSAVVSGTATVAQTKVTADASCAVASLAEELRSLSFGPGAGGAQCLLEVVFPHASPVTATADGERPDGFFSPAERESCPGGTFFSWLDVAQTPVRAAATFVQRSDTGWVPVPLAALEQYSPSCPPSETLLLRLAPGRGAGGSWWLTTIVCAADRPAVAREAAP